jgi:hypothetical protein
MSDRSTRRGSAGSCEPGPAAASPRSAPPEAGIGRFLRRRMAAAFRKQRSDAPPAAQHEDFWLDVRRRLMELPQMGAGAPAPAGFGRRPADRRPRASVPVLGTGRPRGRLPVLPGRLSRIGIAAPDRHDWFIAAALLAFFALGWLAALAAAA